jgi:hypothetical protein
MADTARIRANVGTMIDKGADEAEIDTYLASEGLTAQDLSGARMSPQDEQAYAALAADPDSDAAAIKGFLTERGFNASDEDVAGFLQARQGGARVAGSVRYKLPKAPPRPRQNRPNTGLETASATAQEALNGVLPNAGRFMAGVGGVIGNAIAAPLSDQVDFDPFAAFSEEEAASDLSRERLEEDNPTLANAAWGAGLIGPFALPQARILQGGGLLRGAGNGAITAGGYGALSGAMNNTGEGRGVNALYGGSFGATAGAAAPFLARGGASLASSARRNIPGVDAASRAVGNGFARLRGNPAAGADDAAHAQAERILGETLPDSRIATGMGTGTVQATPDNITTEVLARQARGVPAMPADVTQQGRRVTSWALQGNGPMATRAREVLSQRQAQAGARVRGHLADELGPAVDPIAEAEAITRRARDAAGPAYRQAYAEGSPMVITDELQELMGRPAFREALPQAFRNIQNRGGNPEALGLRLVPHGQAQSLPPNMPHAVTPEGIYVLSNQPTFEAFDQVVRTLNGQLKRNPLNGRLELDNETGAINDVMGSLDRYLKGDNPAYRAAKANFADEMAVRDALERGQDVASLTGPEIQSQLRTMPQHAQEAWMAGARTGLADIATKSSLKPTANVVQRVRQAAGMSGAGSHAALGDQGKLQAIETMSGRPGVMNRLDDRLEAEDQAFKTFNETFGNSKTQPRQAMDEALSGEALQVTGHLLHGNLAGAAAAVLLRGNPQGTFRFKQAVQERIAEIMTATNPRDVRELMAAIGQRAQLDDEFRQLLNQAGITPAKVLSLQSAGLDTREAPETGEDVDERAAQLPVYTRIQP